MSVRKLQLLILLCLLVVVCCIGRVLYVLFGCGLCNTVRSRAIKVALVFVYDSVVVLCHWSPAESMSVVHSDMAWYEVFAVRFCCVTDVLFGEHGFSGKLPRTWFKSVDQLPMNVGDPHYDPLYPFDFGLTTESVKDLVSR